MEGEVEKLFCCGKSVSAQLLWCVNMLFIGSSLLQKSTWQIKYWLELNFIIH